MKSKKIIVTIILASILIISVFVYYFKANRPECYLTIENECMKGYDNIGFELPYWNSLKLEDKYSYKQCCNKPHYVLQGIEPTSFIMKKICEEVKK